MSQNSSIGRLVAFYLSALLLPCLLSCGTSHLTIEATKEQNVIKITDFYVKDHGRRCYSRTTVLFKDTVNQTINSKEIEEYNCRGAYSTLIKSEKWVLTDGVLVKKK